jgi:L-serine dehydratase
MLSAFDLLKIGVGPSSSHTLGPWKAALQWRDILLLLPPKTLHSLKITLYGSLALTGKGHYTDKAIILGLSGFQPENISTNDIEHNLDKIHKHQYLKIGSKVSFNSTESILFKKEESLSFHPNAMLFEAFDKASALLHSSTYYSIGGGFIVEENAEENTQEKKESRYTYKNVQELETICIQENKSISEIAYINECTWQTEEKVKQKLAELWDVMKKAAYDGCHTEGTLPGPLNVKRRAFELNKKLLRIYDYQEPDGWIQAMKVGSDFKKVITRISCLAIAVNEVNASMGRIVTAPTNGSAGVIPAVLFYFLCFSGKKVGEIEIEKFLLTAAEIGKFFKIGATISAAAGGCQAEIGVSSAMAAAALTEGLGGSPQQAFMAAEIAAEHHLGLTCDPVLGLVQIPCIERNSMGAIKAITATMIALASDPEAAKVSLDDLIKTMKETAENMSSRFKETSLGGLALQVGVNYPEC